MMLPAFVASCERTAVREYEAPKEMFPQKSLVSEQLEQAQTSVQTSAISLKAPPGWRRQPPTPMRKASFVVEGADGAKVDISVTSFQGESGGLLANINRWRRQLGLDAVDAEHLEPIIGRRTLTGRDFVIVDPVNELAGGKETAGHRRDCADAGRDVVFQNNGRGCADCCAEARAARSA
jgi:hypothetical protein